jgi:hypothetical protein
MDAELRAKLLAAVLAAAKMDGEEKSLTCAEAHRIADEHGAERPMIGKICNQQKIRIITCQLGLFK